MYSVKIIEDSISNSPYRSRLTSMEICFPRFILAEFNTHRMFCLAGDAELEFDLPSGAAAGGRRVHRMRLDEFVDKWLHGARRSAANPKTGYDLTWVQPEAEYPAPEAAARMGMSSAANIHTLCRRRDILARKHEDGRTWMITGHALQKWRDSSPAHTRFDMRAKLAGMRIRQLNEETGDVQWSTVQDAFVSGEKEVFEVKAGDYSVAGSADHRVLTVAGWKRIGDLTPDDAIIVRKFGKRDDERLDPMRLKKIDGVWRSAWQRTERMRLQGEDSRCRRCAMYEGTQIHHIEPVYQNPSRATDPANITLLCERCHHSMHAAQGWQGGTYLYGAAVRVQSVQSRGVEPTYDLSIAGEYPNFVANGVVVHNSRNSASSRAIPVGRRIAQVRAHPFVPESFGKNQRGMQSSEGVGGMSATLTRWAWLTACWVCVLMARVFVKLDVHKQHANRLIELWSWHTVVVTATNWDNFFNLRTHKAAQPEMQIVAKLMKEAYEASTPRVLHEGMWHLPYITKGEWAILDGRAYDTTDLDRSKWNAYREQLIRKSVVRCAAISYERQDAERSPEQYEKRYTEMAQMAHWSPFEHQAKVASEKEIDEHAYHLLSKEEPRVLVPVCIGNFSVPWLQCRKTFDNESVWVAHD